MNDRVRTVVFSAGALGAAFVMMWGAAGLLPFGSFASAYAAMLLQTATIQRHILNVATAVNFDYRGFDTMGEEFILFASLAGVLMILSALGTHTETHAEPMEGPEQRGQSGAIRWFPTALVAFAAAMGMNVALHTTVTPGGGFQGGAIFGSAFVLIYLGVGYAAFHKVADRHLYDGLEALGAIAYVAVGIGTAFAGGAFLKNILSQGRLGAVVSSGTIFLINACVFVEVGAGFVLLFIIYLHQTRKMEEEE